MRILKISSKRQITLSKADLASLGIGPGGRVSLHLGSGGIEIRPIGGSLVDQLGGGLQRFVDPSKLGLPFEYVRKETQRLAGKHISQHDL